MLVCKIIRGSYCAQHYPGRLPFADVRHSGTAHLTAKPALTGRPLCNYHKHYSSQLVGPQGTDTVACDMYDSSPFPKSRMCTGTTRSRTIFAMLLTHACVKLTGRMPPGATAAFQLDALHWTPVATTHTHTKGAAAAAISPSDRTIKAVYIKWKHQVKPSTATLWRRMSNIKDYVYIIAKRFLMHHQTGRT